MDKQYPPSVPPSPPLFFCPHCGKSINSEFNIVIDKKIHTGHLSSDGSINIGKEISSYGGIGDNFCICPHCKKPVSCLQ